MQGRDRTFFFSFFFSCFLRFLALFDSELGVELADEAAAGDEAVVVVVGATTGLTGVAGAAAAGAGVEAAAGLGLPNEESPEKSKRSVEAELATIVEMDEVEVDVDVDDDDDEAAVLAEVAGGTNEGNLKGISKLSSYCSSPSLLSSSSSSRFRLVTGCSN